MNVGNYVRTKNGKIIKIKDKHYSYLFETEYREEYKVIKSSPNTLDLIGVGDLMLIDISPDNCGGIVVPRIAETQAELDEFISKIQKGEYILEGVLTKEQIENQVYWLGLDKEEE